MNLIREGQNAPALAILILAGAAVTAGAVGYRPPQVPSLFAVKLAVSDVKRASGFYTKYLGMTEGVTFNASEKGIEWTGTGHGAMVVLYQDKCAAAGGSVTGARGPAAMQALAKCESPFRVGSSWVVFRVQDVARVAKQLADGGFPVSDPMTVKSTGIHATFTLTTDPDGNIVEIEQDL
jgi:extradiol dioxygenase family protein